MKAISPNVRTTTRYQRNKRYIDQVAMWTIATVAFFGGWELLVRFGPLQRLVAPPSATLRWSIKHYDRLLYHAPVTFKETVYGFGAALGVALFCGIAIDVVPVLRRGAVALLAASNGIPKIVFAPLLFAWLGYGMAPKIAMGALIAFFPILIGFVQGLQLVDASMQRFLATTGASWQQIFFRVRFPSALRSIVAGCKVAIGLALIGALVSEFINASRGLGYLVKLGEDNFDLEMQFAGIVATSVMGLFLYLCIDLIDSLFLSRFPPLKELEQG